MQSLVIYKIVICNKIKAHVFVIVSQSLLSWKNPLATELFTDVKCFMILAPSCQLIKTFFSLSFMIQPNKLGCFSLAQCSSENTYHKIIFFCIFQYFYYCRINKLFFECYPIQSFECKKILEAQIYSRVLKGGPFL